jgi:hypothetical protein
MRGEDQKQEAMFSYVSPQKRVPEDHPLRGIRAMVDSIEESFGWMKIIGLLKKVKLRGLDKVGWLFTFVGAAYNLYRLQKLKTAVMA